MRNIIKNKRQTKAGFQPITRSIGLGGGRPTRCLSHFQCDRIAELENGITAGIEELKGMLK